MVNAWENWLGQHPEFSFAGKDSDVEDATEEFGYDDDNAEDDTDERRDVTDRDGDSDDDDDESDSSRRLRRLESDNKKLSRELEAAVELLNQAAASEGSSEDSPEGFVPQEDYDSLIDLLRTDYVENAISGYKKKDGTPKYDWEDASAVYKFLDIDELEIDVKSKKIDGLEEQLADIADRYPFMLKSGKRREAGSGSTGKPPRKSGAREQFKNPSIEALVAEFPALVD